MNDMNMILLFYESGMARLKFLHSRVLSKYRGSRNKTKNNGGGNFISDPPIVRLIWFFAKVKISTDTNFSESFMFISFAVLEKTAVEFEKKIENDFFQECLISKRWRIWIWFCYFMKVAWLDLNFCIVAFCQNSAVRGKRACTNYVGILYLTPLLSDWSEFLHKWRFQRILTFLKISCLYHTRFLRKPR